MNYFKHHVNKPTGRVWSLFSELSTASKEMRKDANSISFSHTLEIVNAALSGSISLDEESLQSFNLSAYEFTCSMNDRNSQFSRANKELFIVDEHGNSEEDERVGFGDISMRRLGVRDNNLEVMINSQAFEESLSELLGIRQKVMVDEGIDIVKALYESLMGVASAIKLVQEVTEKNKQVEEIISTLCSVSNGGLCHHLQSVM